MILFQEMCLKLILVMIMLYSNFFQPLHQKFLQGKLKRYRIQYFNVSNGLLLHEESANLSTAVPYFRHTTLESDLDIYVTVEAETSEGRNESLKLDTMLIPRAGTGLEFKLKCSVD